MEPPSRLPRARSHANLRSQSTSTLPKSSTSTKASSIPAPSLLRKPSLHLRPAQAPIATKMKMDTPGTGVALETPTPVRTLKPSASARELSSVNAILAPTRSMSKIPTGRLLPAAPLKHALAPDTVPVEVATSLSTGNASKTTGTGQKMPLGIKRTISTMAPPSTRINASAPGGVARKPSISNIALARQSDAKEAAKIPQPAKELKSDSIPEPKVSTGLLRKPSVRQMTTVLTAPRSPTLVRKPSRIFPSQSNGIERAEGSQATTPEVAISTWKIPLSQVQEVASAQRSERNSNIDSVFSPLDEQPHPAPTPVAELPAAASRVLLSSRSEAFGQTPSPMKRAYSISDTPLFPRMSSYSANGGPGPAGQKHLQLDTIADTSFPFEADSISLSCDSTGSAGKGIGRDDLQAALKAAELALDRMRQERDDARRAEATVKEAIRRRTWEVVWDAIQVEMERNEEYKAMLGSLKEMFRSM